MKRTIIGAIVGAIIIFAWQFLSFAAINFHKSAQDYTDKQDAIVGFLKTQNLKDGGYVMPGVPEGTSSADMEKKMKEYDGQPQAIVQWHNKMERSMNSMIMNMVRGLLVNFVIVLLFCWIIRKMAAPAFSTILMAALAVGLIAFLNEPYTGFIWYKTFDIWASLADAVVAWGLTGIWLGWWMRRGRRELSTVRVGERSAAMA